MHVPAIIIYIKIHISLFHVTSLFSRVMSLNGTPSSISTISYTGLEVKTQYIDLEYIKFNETVK